MNTEVELSGRRLDCALAIASGWTAVRLEHGEVGSHVYEDWYGVHPTNGLPLIIPAYHESVDSLREVEARLRAAGLWLEVISYADGAVQATWRNAETDLRVSGGTLTSSESVARAQAALRALHAIAPTVDESQHD